MKFFPNKDTMEKWEFVLTIAITVLIALELGFAWVGVREAKDQISILEDLKKASQDQAGTLTVLTKEQKKSLESLSQMNDKLQTSVKKTSDMAVAMQQQLEILQEEQNARRAEAAKKPKIELYVANVPLDTIFHVPLKPVKETDTMSVFDVKLNNVGDASARNGTLRIIAVAKDAGLQCSARFQQLYEEPDSTTHVILVQFDVLRAKGNIPMSVTVMYPKGQQPFTVIFNVDADELPTATYLGAMTVNPRKPLD